MSIYSLRAHILVRRASHKQVSKIHSILDGNKCSEEKKNNRRIKIGIARVSTVLHFTRGAPGRPLIMQYGSEECKEEDTCPVGLGRGGRVPGRGKIQGKGHGVGMCLAYSSKSKSARGEEYSGRAAGARRGGNGEEGSCQDQSTQSFLGGCTGLGFRLLLGIRLEAICRRDGSKEVFTSYILKDHFRCFVKID